MTSGMHYYVDGYNFLLREEIPHPLEQARKQFLQYLSERAALLNLNITVVFDASFEESLGARQYYRGVDILFTEAGETADEWILKKIANSSTARQSVVVTGDRQLRRLASMLSAKTESITHFRQRLVKAPKEKSQISRKRHIAQRIEELQSGHLHERRQTETSHSFMRASTQEMERWLNLFEKRWRDASECPEESS